MDYKKKERLKTHLTISNMAVLCHSTSASTRTQFRLMTKSLTCREGRKTREKHADINGTVNLSEPVMVDYSLRGHCVEQSELMEPDTCQSKTSPGPDLIQDILLLLGEITGPAVLSL